MSTLDDLPFPEELRGVVQVCNPCARGHACEKHRFKGFTPITAGGDEVRDHARAVVRPDLELDGVAIQLSPRSGQAISFTATKIQYDETQATEVKAHPLRLGEDAARALYEALGRHFGGDAVSNTQLRSDYNHERLEKAVEYLQDEIAMRKKAAGDE